MRRFRFQISERRMGCERLAACSVADNRLLWLFQSRMFFLLQNSSPTWFVAQRPCQCDSLVTHGEQGAYPGEGHTHITL
jgi:hypothetical protein